MRKINAKSNNNDSFKYSILISLHYPFIHYDTHFHIEKTTKLDAYANNYNFTNANPTYFEKSNPNISLNILSEHNKLV